MQTKVIKFLNEPNDEDYLWRYIDINRFLSFLLEKKLHLSRFDQLSDAHEGSFPEDLLKKLALNKLKGEPEPKLEHAVMEFVIHITDKMLNWSKEAEAKLYQQLYYTNCWLIGKRESMAMWTTYSNQDSVAIKIQYKHLKNIFLDNAFKIKEIDNFYQIKLGKVEYLDFINLDENVIEVEEKFQVGFTKDLSYIHENEFRICLIKNDPKIIWKKYQDKKKWSVGDEKELLANKGLSIELNNFKEIPFEVIFHPKADKYSKENIKTLLNKLELPFKTFDSEVLLR